MWHDEVQHKNMTMEEIADEFPLETVTTSICAHPSRADVHTAYMRTVIACMHVRLGCAHLCVAPSWMYVRYNKGN